MKKHHDLLDRERSLEELERLAGAWRNLAPLDAAGQISVVHFLENTVSSLFPHYAVIPRSSASLPENLALTSYGPTRIEALEKLYLAAARGHPKACAELIHEFGHVVLHNELPKSLLDGKQERIKLLNLNLMSVEEQADLFALFFLVPRYIVETLRDISQVLYTCNVPYALVLKAFKLYGVRPKRKLLPYEVQHLMTNEEEPY